MSQKTKFTYEFVCDYVKSKNCTLLSEKYTNSKSKLEVLCNCGELMNTTWNKFKDSSHKCIKCLTNLQKINNTNSFEKVNNFIKDNDCELLSEYKNAKDKLLLKCKCGNEFEKSFNKFKGGQNRCKSCKGVNTWDLETIKNFVEIESKSNSTLMTTSTINSKTKLQFKCECGNNYETSFRNFLHDNKRRCDECGINNRIKAKTIGIENLKLEVLNNSDCQLLSDSYNGLHDQLEFLCECKTKFKTSIIGFRNGKKNCTLCNGTSKLETKTLKFFKNNNIYHEEQYSIDELKSSKGYKLKFDFCVFNKSREIIFLLELDGQQHFHPVEFFGGKESFEKQKINDELKNEYCKNNNLKLERIPYTELDNLDEILKILLYKYDNPVPSL